MAQMDGAVTVFGRYAKKTLRYNSLIWARRLGRDYLPMPSDGAILLGWPVTSLVSDMRIGRLTIVSTCGRVGIHACFCQMKAIISPSSFPP